MNKNKGNPPRGEMTLMNLRVPEDIIILAILVGPQGMRVVEPHSLQMEEAMVVVKGKVVPRWWNIWRIGWSSWTTRR